MFLEKDNAPVVGQDDARSQIETDLYLTPEGDLIFVCPHCAVEKQAGRPCRGEVFAPEGEDGLAVHLFLDNPEDGIATAFMDDGKLELECLSCCERTPWEPADGARIRMRHRDCDRARPWNPPSVED